MNRLLFVAALALVGFTSAACDEKLSDITGPTPQLTANLSSIQREIFSTTDSSGRLACVGCHTDRGPFPAASNLVLLEGRAYQQLVGRASLGKPGATLVIPGDPDNSYLVKKLEGAADINGLRMPRNNGPFLTEGQMLVIRRWISEGAAKN
jgi:hypothetical protein